MAIQTLDQVIAGCQPPNDFYKVGAQAPMAAGTLYSHWQNTGLPGASPVCAPGLNGVNLVTGGAGYTITGNTQASPSIVAIGTYLPSGTQVTITGSNSNPVINGTYVVQNSDATHVTVPVNVNVAPGTTGTMVVNSYPGQIVTPAWANNSYLARFAGTATAACDLLLCDRIWHNSGYTITQTTVHSITSPTWPARDANGATAGVGVLVGLEITGTIGTGSPVTNTTLQYTGTVNGASQTGTLASVATAAKTGTFYPFQLAAGDTGVTSVQGLTLGTSYVSGTIALVAYRVIAKISCAYAGSGGAVDAVSGGLPRIYNGTIPFILEMPSTATATNILGHVIITQG